MMPHLGPCVFILHKCQRFFYLLSEHLRIVACPGQVPMQRDICREWPASWELAFSCFETAPAGNERHEARTAAVSLHHAGRTPAEPGPVSWTWRQL